MIAIITGLLIKNSSTFPQPIFYDNRLRNRMRKLIKNSTAVLGIVFVAFAALAQVHAGPVVFGAQRIKSASTQDVRVTGHAALTRVPKNSIAFLRAKSRQPSQNAVADVSTIAFTYTLPIAGPAPTAAAFMECTQDGRPASARAPPNS